MDEEQRLRIIVTQRRAADPTPVSLGGLIGDYIGSRVCSRQELIMVAADICRGQLPSELAEHCSISDVSMGRVEILLDLPTYLYEIRRHRSELLSELQKGCRGVKLGSADRTEAGLTPIKRVSFRVGSLKNGVRL